MTTARRAILAATVLLTAACGGPELTNEGTSSGAGTNGGTSAGGTSAAGCHVYRLITYFSDGTAVFRVAVTVYDDNHDLIANCVAANTDFPVHPDLVDCTDVHGATVSPNSFATCTTSDTVAHITH